MNRADYLRSFVAAAELSSFAAAGRRLNLSRDQVSKQIAALEAELRTPLFLRSTRHMALTGAGELLLAKSREALRLLDEALGSVTQLQTGVHGSLRVNAPMSFGQRYLAPLLPAFHLAHPELLLRVELDDRIVDPAKSGADVTLRIAQLPEHLDLVARPLATAPRFLVATPSYWERWGEPTTPGSLAQHACLHYGEAAGGSTWQFERADGQRRSVSVKGPICSNNGDLLLQAALSGLGLTVLPEFLLREALESGSLRRAMLDWRVFPDIGLFALYAPATKGMPAVRAFVEHLQRELVL